MYVLPVFKEGEIRIPGDIQGVGYNAGNTYSQMNQPNSINLAKTNSVTCRVQKLGVQKLLKNDKIRFQAMSLMSHQ